MFTEQEVYAKIGFCVMYIDKLEREKQMLNAMLQSKDEDDEPVAKEPKSK